MGGNGSRLFSWVQSGPWRKMRAKSNAKVIKRLNELGVGQIRYELQKLQNVRDLTNQDEKIQLGNNISAKRSEIDIWIRQKDKWAKRKIWIAPDNHSYMYRSLQCLAYSSNPQTGINFYECIYKHKFSGVGHNCVEQYGKEIGASRHSYVVHSQRRWASVSKVWA